MAPTEIWWESRDRETGAMIDSLGGRTTIEAAVDAVMPDRRIKVRALTPGISGAVVFLASPQAIRDGRRVTEVEGVLKIGRARLLCDEVDNWKRWVEHMLDQLSHFALLHAPDGLKAVAASRPDEIHALHYRHVGHTTLGERLREMVFVGNTEGACRLIDTLLVILRPWQEHVEPENSKALTSDNVYSFGADPFDAFEDTCERVNALCSEPDAIPASFRRVRDLWKENALGSERFLQSIIHGDLHIDNVLIGRDGGLTLIDFGATGMGHFLRDLTTLEAHLVLRGLSPTGASVGDEHRAYLAEIAPLYTAEVFLRSDLAGRVTPLQAVVMRLRRYAFFSLMRFNLDYVPQYAFAVLRHAIAVCGRAETSFSDGQRWIAGQVAVALREALEVSKRRLVIAHTSQFDYLAAYRSLDEADHGDVLGDIDISSRSPCGKETWDALARSLRSARRVDFIGIVPIRLISSILAAWENSDATDAGLPKVVYLTRPYGSETRTGRRPAPMWEKAALTGVRNIVNASAGDTLSLDGFARAADGVSANCLIRRTGYDNVVSLYLASRITEPEALERPHVITRLPDEDGEVSDWVDATFARAEPILIREVECEPLGDIEDASAASATCPRIVGLSPYGANTLRATCLRPVALTILRYSGPAGRQVLLKVRSALVDNDDFGRYSFLSARILADDIAGAKGVTIAAVEDADDALDALWNSVGRPDEFVLTEDVFVHAARRDVFGTTLLDLAAERFDFKGMHMIRHETHDIELGFAVLAVDLDRKEVAEARRTSRIMGDAGGELLQLVPVSEIFTGKLPVNRFMQHRRDWLMKHCL